MFDIRIMTAIGVALLIAIVLLMFCVTSLLFKLTSILKDKIAAASSITASCYPGLQLYDECQLCNDSKSLPPGFCDVSEGL
ncbi:protein FAM24A-like isoform X2 [Myotis daubentonii]|uniref:protein FAM24A-like isoform X2 n=1 Tax=Myotis daubentonii TaxID=98922 RepID=UPI00287325C7|nr:protein FAM24A-like isoform X2 [Myotis daubentonii]